MTTSQTSNAETPIKRPEEFVVLLVSDDVESGYAVFCPSLPGCNSQGDDCEDALTMIADAIEGFLAIPYRRVEVPADATDRLIAEYKNDGYHVEVATVHVVV